MIEPVESCVLTEMDAMDSIVLSGVSNGSGLPGCGPGLEPDRTVQSGLSPGKQGYPPGSGTG